MRDTPAEHSEPLHVGGLVVVVCPVPGRRSVRVTVDRDARIVAAVPPDADRTKLEKLLRGRLPWLYEKAGARTEQAAKRPNRTFANGDGFHYLGRSHRLRIVAEAPRPVALTNGWFQLREDRRAAGTAAADLVAWYIERGQQRLPARVAHWAAILAAPPADLVVRPLGYRWGSCSHRDSDRGIVNIHWAVMQLPVPLVDYVIVHELSHLREPHHSPAFWRLVTRALPDYGTRRAAVDEWGASVWLPE
ncbi:SprT family zinc-dependent metalloprotease [Streptomyces sp. NPDC006655]|uniref:M48 family metallopeptidase n=1 Tax=Streptomyces sp. NPDC006655 TaxID=3156898 RepID=UPI0034512E6C